MSGQTTLSFWQLLLLALGPATLAATVAILAPILLEARKQAAEKKKLKGQKLEALVLTIHSASVWLEKTQNNRVYGTGDEIPPSPLAEVETLTNIYFPQFKQQAYEFDQAARKFELWMFGAARKRLAGKKDFDAGMMSAFEPFLDARNKFQKDLVNFAREWVA